MNLKVPLLALALVSVSLVGCIGEQAPEEEADSENVDAQAIDPETVQAPEGAKKVLLEDGVRLVWENAALPLEASIPIPGGSTIVNATTTVDAEAQAWTNLTHARTQLPRCQTPTREDLLSQTTGPVSCTGLTELDELPATWNLSVEADVDTASRVQVDLRSVPTDGLAGQLDTDKLSKPIHNLSQVENFQVQGAGGTSLNVDVHKPDAEGPFPAILISRLAANASAQQAAELTTGLDVEVLAQELAARGYAVAVADVRGTGGSGGCLDAWGAKEQADQAQLAQWVSEQNFTTDQLGAVGFGYSATTAIEAAIAAPDTVDAVVALGGVTDAYRDWHFGGVPNGEGVSQLYGDQVFGALGYDDPTSPIERLTGTNSEDCEGSQYAEASDPRAVYNEFYKIRNKTEQMGSIQAPVLHAQGTFDLTTKPSMAKGVLGNLQAPSLSMVGPWAHQLPTRADALTLVFAWLDQNVQEREVGLEASVAASVTTPSGLQHVAPTWPPAKPDVTTLYPDFGAGELTGQPAEGSAEILLDPLGATTRASASNNRTLVNLAGTIDEPMHLSGSPEVSLSVQLQGMENAFVAAYLEATFPDGTERVVSFGMANLAHRGGHGSYAPVPPGEAVGMALPMQPTEMVLPADTELELTIRSSATTDWKFMQPGRTGQLTLLGGADGTALAMPTVPSDKLAPAPTSAVPGPAQVS